MQCSFSGVHADSVSNAFCRWQGQTGGGMVHVYVDQKPVKSNIFTSFIWRPKVAIESLF